MKKTHLITSGIKILLLALLLFTYLYHLASYPPPAIWDEGWTLSVAKNWVHDGFYGHYKSGEPQPPGMSASYTVVIPIALSFKVFGVGIWQGRLPVALFAIGALCLIFFLGRRQANAWVGCGAVLAALFLEPHLHSNPVYFGRQVLAEMPMLFYLLLGYTFFLRAHSSWLRLLAAILAWGVALQTKAQLLPFLMAALAFPLLFALLRRQWKSAAIFTFAMGGSWLAAQGINHLWAWAIQDHTLPRQITPRLVATLAATLNPGSRQAALLAILTIGLPAAIALGYALITLYRKCRKEEPLSHQTLIWFSLLAFCGSWYAWYAVLSIGWSRYLMPAVFVGSLFVSKMVYELTGGGSLRALVQQLNQAILHLNFSRQNWLVLPVFILVVLLATVTLTQCYLPIALSSPDPTYQQAMDYLRTQIPSDALIETYEVELLFFLDRPIHYPPDEVSVTAIEKRSNPAVSVDYDPLASDPDYLVIGNYARIDNIYAPVLNSNQFTLLENIGIYAIYQRQR